MFACFPSLGPWNMFHGKCPCPAIHSLRGGGPLRLSHPDGVISIWIFQQPPLLSWTALYREHWLIQHLDFEPQSNLRDRLVSYYYLHFTKRNWPKVKELIYGKTKARTRSQVQFSFGSTHRLIHKNTTPHPTLAPQLFHLSVNIGHLLRPGSKKWSGRDIT